MAQSCWNSLDLQAFEEIVALLIYGMVLFPNPYKLIDVNAVKIFMSRNPTPTLQGDILHSFHRRTMMKRGILMCCNPLLARCFISYLVQYVLKNEQGSRWSHRLMTVIGGKRTDCFGMLVRVLRLFSQNVAVSKSRHRLLFYPTRKGKKHIKIPF